ncbi:MAG: UDP-N-acetylglucosamine-N-acetylmuramyl-(pentapeptide) pyrophosphoryl-UDP N-acetylglucosamine transferase [Candidatus Magasanikbacteria bacterium GW2011_GWC2_37_14]|uniref:UDP-N-acetylglucosamine--N-acetylmuramyl-(pentapeptide) pyrophosphoryl-undecaprenol N-acetylglucosamine transferase n=1 Tax=Candidatus Magasanikbacteria bacterium GW2011_GWC2_37_14 TaxID=1619046 RepID=A0A0G0G8K8_9BACT|nr:MAG: UDP-N-acetylglucosamine-N-acetylmuramyl-(pentapeptide) pyrophosphoryl-UDP N-acetylglucosamine transferase [Candidatus Magasanikbacteria bacterium GW2011_GWC2_37_14]
MKIIFSGGYTLGPVTPLLAVSEVIKKHYPNVEFLWIGTKKGPEKKLINEQGIKFITLPAGKFRRYLSPWNLIDIAKIIAGFFKALKIMWQEEPVICISAGGFVSVPVHFAAWLFGVPTWIHQQDVIVGLANKLMAPVARVISTALKDNVQSFGKLRIKKTIWLGNPVRAEIFGGNLVNAEKIFNLKKNLPVVFAMGGGTGSMRLNQLIIQSIPHLKGFCQVIHLSGLERPQELVSRAQELFADYYQVHKFFSAEMKDAYSASSIVISRGGFGSLSEIAALGKPAIIIPKPGHQIENVRFLNQAGAVILLDERTADGNLLAKTIRELLVDQILQRQMSTQIQKMLPRASEEKILAIIKAML